MYVNKCVKCGREFETKNPKRVICPDCLYPDKKMMINSSVENETSPAQDMPSNPEQEKTGSYSTENQPQFYNSYSAGEDRPRPQRAYSQNSGYGQSRQYNGQRRDNQNSGYARTNYPQNRSNNYNRDGGYQRRDNQGSGYNRGGYQNRSQQGSYNRNNYNNNRRPQSGGYNRGGYNARRPMPRNKAPKQLLVSKDQLEQIELLYKMMLPLPNPDAHEVIGEKISLEPRKVFFGINLVRQKLMLPKLPFPKRKLAITPDQLFAIRNLYEPLLPLPPIGCHKIIAAQLKMDEWRVHVGIGLIRSQMGLQRWNQEREDAPAEFKNQKKEEPVNSTQEDAPVEAVVEEKPKRGRKPKKAAEPEPAEE